MVARCCTISVAETKHVWELSSYQGWRYFCASPVEKVKHFGILIFEMIGIDAEFPLDLNFQRWDQHHQKVVEDLAVSLNIWGFCLEYQLKWRHLAQQNRQGAMAVVSGQLSVL